MAVAQKLNRANRNETYSGYTDLDVEACPSCGVLHAFPSQMNAEAQRLGGHRIEISCPNGHVWGYSGKSAEAKERERREAAEREAARERALRDQAEAEARAQKGRATRFKNDRDRIKNRVAHGVCPCCNRTFKQLDRHMKAKHPDYLAEVSS